MTESKAKIEFHPRRLSHSSSKQKFSPYRKKVKRDKNADILLENREKIENNQPIIKFKELIGNSHCRSKLKLATEKCYTNVESQATTQSNSTYNRYLQVQNINSYNLLLAKMQEQTNFMRHHFKEMKKDLRLPKLSNNQQQNQQKEQLNQDRYEQNQKIILGYLQELSRNSSQIQVLKNINRNYQDELVKLKIEIYRWQEKCAELEKELIFEKIQRRSERDVSVNFEQQQRKMQHQKSRSISGELIIRNILTQKECEISEDASKQMKRMQNQLTALKLQLEMLQEQVKLLNYSLNERDQQITTLKERINSMNFQQNIAAHMKKSDNLSIKSMTGSTPINLYRKNRSQIKFEHSIDKKLQQMSYKESRQNGKRLSQILFQSVNSDQQIKDQPNSLFKMFQSRRVLPDVEGSEADNQEFKDQNINEISKLLITSPICQISKKQYLRKSVSLIDYSRFNIAKSYLKIRRKDSFISKQSRQRLKKQMTKLQCFTQQKMYLFNLIRRTLAYKFKGLKCTYQQFQEEIMKRHDNILTAQAMSKILSEHPFLLGNDLIQTLLDYITKEKSGAKNQMQISADKFCNKMRQFIPDYEPIDEEEEVRAIQKIKKTIIACQTSIMSDLSQHEVGQGIIDQQKFTLILDEYKFTEFERQAIISQCCIISSDADHLSYSLYLSIFEYNQ